ALNVVVGDADVVVLRGLVLNGFEFTSDTVRMAGSGTLQVESCVIDGIGNGRGGANGIVIEQDGDGRVVLADTVIRNVVGNDAHALRLFGASDGSTRLALERVRLVGNTNGSGLVVQRGDGVLATIRDSFIGQNELHGVQVSAIPTTDVMIERTVITDNGQVGLAAGGSRTTVRLRTVTVVHNAVGISGAILSYGDNVIDANGTNGAPAE